MSRVTVACVLRSGGVYGPEYVSRLHDGVAAHLSADHDFICLTDRPEWFRGIEAAPLEHDWPGWWSKIELFRSDLFTGRVLYLDLDTSIVGPLEEIAAYDGPFAMIDDWNWPDQGASGVMAWRVSDRLTQDIYRDFCRMAEGAMASHRGDQNWIHGATGGTWDPLRELFPGQIVSRWVECADGVPDDARICCWHGTPKPHEIDWALTGSRRQWREALA